MKDEEKIRENFEKFYLEKDDGMNYQPTIADAIAAGDAVLLNEQAALLRECRLALDVLLQKKPMLAGMKCGSTTLGNLRASLYEHRPQGVVDVAMRCYGVGNGMK